MRKVSNIFSRYFSLFFSTQMVFTYNRSLQSNCADSSGHQHIYVGNNHFLLGFGKNKKANESQTISPNLIPAILMFYLCSTVSFQQFRNLDYEVCFILCLSTFALVNLFIFCYFGRIATDSFAKMSDCVYFKLNWQKIPPKQQAIVVLMIRNMQKPIHFHGFDVAIMDLNTFIQVN